MDIVLELGKIKDIETARKLFKEKMDEDNFNKISKIENEDVLLKIAASIALCNPDSVFINTGSSKDKKFIKELSLKKGEEKRLPMQDHTIHYDLKEEQGRIIDRTFYIVSKGETVSSLAQKIERNDAFDEVKTKMANIMAGKTMMVGFYMRGPIGAYASNPAIEITSSAYVSHSAEILYRNAFEQFESEIDRLGYFYTNVHSEGKNRAEDLPHARVFMDRKYQTTYSINCTYAGNTLLLKKGNHRFSVDRAVYKNRGKELSEHMFITGIAGTGGRITWFAGAAPSGCGKTTTAMAGAKFIGDDLAQMWIDESGDVKAINPEVGIFGIVEDVNKEGDPILMKLLRQGGCEVIWSNVLIDEKALPHWVGNGEAPPKKGYNFQGDWEEGIVDENGKKIPLSHPNARVTISAKSLENCSDKIDAPEGVPVRVITYSGRDGNTMPPILVAKTPEEGVIIGATLVSQATATEVGAHGVKRAPWANAPFIPGNITDYLNAQFDFFTNDKIKDELRPLMVGLNYFLTREERGLPGSGLIGEKRDVKVWLSWLEKRVHNEVDAIKTPVGYIPFYEDLKELFEKILGKKYDKDIYDRQFTLYADNIIARIEMQLEAYKKEKNISQKLFDILNKQKNKLNSLKEKHGSLLHPDIFKQ